MQIDDIFVHDSYFIVQIPSWLIATAAVATVVGSIVLLACLWRGRWPWR
jgi:hypothetical protein